MQVDVSKYGCKCTGLTKQVCVCKYKCKCTEAGKMRGEVDILQDNDKLRQCALAYR